MTPSEADQASELVLRAAELLRSGAPVNIALLRAPLAELLDDAADGDDEGVISPYVEVVARAVLGQSA